MASKHTKTDGDSVLEQAKARRAEEIQRFRETDPDFNDIVPEGWIARETGFPPYLVMRAGARFRAQVLLRDERDEYVTADGEVRPFVRYHLKLVAPAALECKRGPNDERGESVLVHTGQIFTIGAYASLESELNALAGLELAVICRKEVAFKDRQTQEPRKRYVFDTFVSAETEKMLQSDAAEIQASLREAYKEARKLAVRNQFLFQSEPAKAPAEHREAEHAAAE